MSAARVLSLTVIVFFMALLGMLSLKLGKSIEWDGAKERIVGDDAANKLLRRDYRKGYEYPKA